MHTLKLKWKDIIGNTTGRVMLSLVLFAIILCSGFVSYTYNSKIEAFREAEISKLKSISNILAVQIDADAHTKLLASFPNEDDIYRKGQNDYYDELQSLLKKIRNANDLSTDIYTLVYNPDLEIFEFGVSSSETPFFRHKWNNFTDTHIEKYETGYDLGPYQDEHGTWLSSFAPIKSEHGETVAIVQVDEPFDSFIAKANKAVSTTIAIMICVLGVLIYSVLHIVQRLLNKADRVKKTLHKQRLEIEIKNREMLSSINRAKTIQDSILPQIDKLKESFPEMFIMFEPKDIVSGDFFWHAEKDDAVYFAVADCTGHGVPGAFMSMMGHTILNDVLKYKSVNSPAEILTALDMELTRMLQENGGSSADGMDIALIRYCKISGKVEFAGALRPLIVTSKKKITKYKGDKHSIGGRTDSKKVFTNHAVCIGPEDTLYMFSDGYYDQFGGAHNKKYMSKNFGDLLLFAESHHIEDQQYLLQYEFHHWKADEEQIDDVLVAGIKIPVAA